MSYIREIKNKNGTISYKARVNYKGVFLTKTFPIKGNQKKTTYKLAENWCNEIEQKVDEGTYRKEEKRAIIDDVHTSFGYYLRFSGRCFVVDNPAAVVKAVVVTGRGNKNYLCRIFCIIFKNI